MKKKEKNRKRNHNYENDTPEYLEIEDISCAKSHQEQDPSEWTVINGELQPTEETRRLKEQIAQMISKNQREYDLQQFYGIDSTSEDETLNFLEDPTSLSRSFNRTKEIQPLKTVGGNFVKDDHVDEAVVRELNEHRRKRILEVVKNILWILTFILQQVFILLEKVIRYSSNHPNIIRLVIFVFGIHFVIFHLEFSVVTLVEWTFRWFWPTVRIFLRASEVFLRGMVVFLEQISDLGEAAYCDIAETWCIQFGLMCNKKCSYLDRALKKAKF
ncbi:hypothetical protein FO519_008041 [Halicephalobus sp. NKZ332]|nr:hypothetical protein FO519_008041 [Halicephalobus sp. NKZ332]